MLHIFILFLHNNEIPYNHQVDLICVDYLHAPNKDCGSAYHQNCEFSIKKRVKLKNNN